MGPLRKAVGKTKIIYRVQANHELRYLEPKNCNVKALEEIRKAELKLGARAGSLHDLLDLGRFSVDIDNNVQTLIKNRFLLTHGERVSANAPKLNLQEYGISGTSGHTHRMGVYNQTAKGTGERMIFVESGHLRTQGTKVEYMKKPPDWQQGYVVLYMRKDGMHFDVQPHQINGGKTIFNSILYQG